MTEQARESIRPNFVAALPGRMVDEAPKRHGRDAGARDQKLIPYILGLFCAFAVMVLLFATGVVSILLEADGLGFHLVLGGLMLVAFTSTVAGFGGYTFLNLRTRSYTLYDDRVEMNEGFLKQEAKTLPFDRVTNVTLRQNVWERRFDAGTVRLQTAGSEDAELWLRGIDDPETVADRIRKRVEAVELEGGNQRGD